MTLTGVLQGDVPVECRRLFPNYEDHRRQLKESVRVQLLNDNKRLLKLRVLADGWIADWEKILQERDGSLKSHSGLTNGREVSSSFIGTKLEPVDLTLWDDEEQEFKRDVGTHKAAEAVPILKPEHVNEPPRPDGSLLEPHLPRDTILFGHLQPDTARIPERDEPLVPDAPRPRPRTPTRPRNKRLNPDAPYLPRRALVFQRESHSSNHRYIRSDHPGSLQLHRLTPSRSTTRGVTRTRLTRRNRAERRGYREYDGRYDRNEDEHRPSTRLALEDQQSVYHRARGRRAPEWPDTPNPASASYPIGVQEQSMQIDAPSALTGMVPQLFNAEEENATLFIPERPTSPDMDYDMLDEFFVEETPIEDAQSNPRSSDRTIKSSVPVNELPDDELASLSSSSSSSGHSSSEENKRIPTRTRIPSKETSHRPRQIANHLLASINFASVKDMLHDSTPTPDSMFNKPIDRKPPVIRTTKLSTSSQHAPEPISLTEQHAKPSGPKPKTKAPPPRLSMKYRHAETVKLPKPDYARARRLLAPPNPNNSLVWISMPGDVQFVRDDERARVEQWSLPAPARLKDGSKKLASVVTDACLLGDSSVVMVHETGPHPASIVRMPYDYDDVPVRHDLSHTLVPASSIQRRGILSSVCALDSQQIFTGCMDKRVLLWNVHDTSADDDAPKVSIKALDIAHAASVRALAYSSSRTWLVSAAGAKLAVTDVSTGQAIVRAGKQKWASNDVFNVHFHAKDPNMLLVETGDLDKQARIYDLRKIQKTDIAPERLIGSTETGAISQYVRGDWAKSLVVRPSSLNMVKVWDIRQPDRPLSVHTLSHNVTHCIFIDDCRTIAATGEHFVTFLDARV